jgi:hypothetical protein
MHATKDLILVILFALGLDHHLTLVVDQRLRKRFGQCVRCCRTRIARVLGTPAEDIVR